MTGQRSGLEVAPETAVAQLPAVATAMFAQDTAPAPAPRALSPVETAGVIDGVLVVVVRTEGGRYRRRVFLTLAAAERAVAAARARGLAAEVVLCALAPAASPAGAGR